MNDDDPPKLAIPFDWVIVDAIGAVVAAVGVLGLTGGGAAIHPVLGNTAIAGTCVAVGIALMVVALAKILRHMRASAARGRR